MRPFAARWCAAAFVLGLNATAPVHAASATVEVLHAFSGADGAAPYGGLVQGGDGNFYGTSSTGGANGAGTIFRISPAGALATVHEFTGPGGKHPIAGLSLGSDGNFYGSTERGGTNDRGTVFRLTPSGSLTTLFHFDDAHGAYPRSAPLLASDGSLYGVAAQGGTSGYGTVYKLTTSGTATRLFSFDVTRGQNPHGALIAGSDGNFYGTTERGGSSGGHGTVFRISSSGTLVSLASFDGTSRGAAPEAALLLASDGNYYGTAQGGGASAAGTVFKMTSAGVVTNLASFGGADGAGPRSALVAGTDGNLYGTTADTIFRITPAGTMTTLYRFAGNAGGSPQAGLVRGADGNYYGTTRDGGPAGKGTVFRMLPPPASPAGLSATAGDRTVTLSWGPSASAASYNLYRGTTEGAQDAVPFETGITATGTTVTELASGKYFFTVTAVSPNGESGPSNEAAATVNIPDDYTFEAVTDAAKGSTQQSNVVTISGLIDGTTVPVSISGDAGAAYSLNGGAYTSTPGAVANGTTLRLRVNASASANATTRATVSTGRTSRTFSVTTLDPDTVPAPFAFDDAEAVAPRSVQTSNAVVIQGINAPAPVSIGGASGATYSINGGAFTASPGTINNGSTVRVRLTAPEAFGATASATLDVGGVSATYTVETGADDVPDPFAFAPLTDVPPGSVQVSDAIVIAGISAPTNVAVTGDAGAAYSINGGAFTTAAATVGAGDSLRVRVNAAAVADAVTRVTLTAGGVHATFTVTTAASAPAETAGALDALLLAMLLAPLLRRRRV